MAEFIYFTYSNSYEERNRSLETVASRHKESKTFEDFIAKIYSPITSLHIIAAITSSVTSSTITAAALIDQTPHHRSSVKNTTNSSNASSRK